jgi:O-antigen/teichoic acid export membrane protein
VHALENGLLYVVYDHRSGRVRSLLTPADENELPVLRAVLAEIRGVWLDPCYMLVPVTSVTVNGLFFALGSLSVTSAMAAWIGGQALATVVLAAYVRIRMAGFGRPDRPLARRAVGFGLKAHWGRVMMLGNYRADQWLVGAMAGSRELGLYSVAVAWAESLFYLPTAIASVQRPDLVRSSPTEAARQTAVASRATVLVSVPAAAIMAAAAPLLCVWAFGDDFRGSIDDLRVLTAGAIGIAALKLSATRSPRSASRRSRVRRSPAPSSSPPRSTCS